MGVQYASIRTRSTMPLPAADVGCSREPFPDPEPSSGSLLPAKVSPHAEPLHNAEMHAEIFVR